MTAFTICVTSTLSDLRVVRTQTVSDNTDRKIITVSCPSGKRVTGAAAYTSAPGNVEVVVPDAALTNVQAIGRSDTPRALQWHVTVYAFCAA